MSPVPFPRLLLLAASLLPALALGQVGAPAEWRKETFTFPLPFAPTIPYEGTEHVRFSPQWSKFATEQGFTYVFLWDLKRREVPPQELEKHLNAYFDGLMESVTKNRKLEDPGTVSAASLHPMKAPEGWAEGYGGRVFTWNGFAKGEKIGLHMEVTQRACGTDRTHVFFAFSLQPRESPVWQQLREIRAATPC
jgi:hypothetical protein